MIAPVNIALWILPTMNNPMDPFQSPKPGQDTDLDRAAVDAVMSMLKQQGDAGNKWPVMAMNGIQWVRGIRDGHCTTEQALKGLLRDFARCRADQSNAEAVSVKAATSDLHAPELPKAPYPVVDERSAWAADMVAAGAKHLGGECWEWDVDDFEFRLWQIARRSRPQQSRPRAMGASRKSLKRPTPAQLNILRQVKEGFITRHGEAWAAQLYICRPSMGRNPRYFMMCKLKEAGWIDHECVEDPQVLEGLWRMGKWQIVLTDAGRAVLAG